MYNEESGAEKCVRTVCPVLESFPYRTALFVVNDGSKDRTGNILARLAQEHGKLIALTHERNAGYGAALRTGVQRAASDRFDYVLFMDSDLTNDPNDIPRFVDKMLQGYDVIKACRYCKGGRIVGVPAYRVVLSKLGNRVTSLLYGLHLTDCTNGFRAVRVSILRRMNLTEHAFPIIMEELYCAKFLAKSFCEIPATLTNRTPEQRPTSFAYRPSTLYRYLKYAVMSSLRIEPSSLRFDRSS